MRIKNCQYIAVLILYFFSYIFSYAEPLAGRIIVIDPGHAAKNSRLTTVGQAKEKIVNYGCKSGAGTKEMDVVIDIAEVLGDIFLRNGATVYFTRDRKNFWLTAESQYDDNKNRAVFANSKTADIFLRVHCNWVPDKKKRGVLILWYKNDSEKMAETVYKEIKKSGVIMDGIKKQHLVGFEFAKVPAILVEYGYLSNKKDEKLLKNKKYIKKVSIAVVKGLEKCFLLKE